MKELIVSITGKVRETNFVAFEKDIDEQLKKVKKELVTEQDFNDAKETVKVCVKAEAAIKAAQEQALSETKDISALFKSLERVSAKLAETRKTLKKQIKADLDNNKNNIVNTGIKKYQEHAEKLFGDIPELKSIVDWKPKSFVDCVYKKGKVHTIQAAVDNNLASEIDKISDIFNAAKAAITRIDSVGNNSLFPDTAALIAMTATELEATISSRVAKHELQKTKEEAKPVTEPEVSQPVVEPKGTPQALFKAEQEEAPVPAPGFIDCPEPQLTFMDHVAPISPEPVVERPDHSVTPPDTIDGNREEFVIEISLLCDVEWAKEMASRMRVSWKGLKDFRHFKLRR